MLFPGEPGIVSQLLGGKKTKMATTGSNVRQRSGANNQILHSRLLNYLLLKDRGSKLEQKHPNKLDDNSSVCRRFTVLLIASKLLERTIHPQLRAGYLIFLEAKQTQFVSICGQCVRTGKMQSKQSKNKRKNYYHGHLYSCAPPPWTDVKQRNPLLTAWLLLRKGPDSQTIS